MFSFVDQFFGRKDKLNAVGPACVSDMHCVLPPTRDDITMNWAPSANVEREPDVSPSLTQSLQLALKYTK